MSCRWLLECIGTRRLGAAVRHPDDRHSSGHRSTVLGFAARLGNVQSLVADRVSQFEGVFGRRCATRSRCSPDGPGTALSLDLSTAGRGSRRRRGFGERCPHHLDMAGRICAECNWLAVGGEFGREFQSQRCQHTRRTAMYPPELREWAERMIAEVQHGYRSEVGRGRTRGRQTRYRNSADVAEGIRKAQPGNPRGRTIWARIADDLDSARSLRSARRQFSGSVSLPVQV
ncbi:hypothetical protein ABIE52_000495 [Rhodococcus sp. OAS809]